MQAVRRGETRDLILISQLAREGRGADLPLEISTSVKEDINRVVATDVHMLCLFR